MRRFLVAGAVVAAAVLAGTPALAAPPEISQKSCDADGGAFAREHGGKSCTVTTTRVDEGRVLQFVVEESAASGAIVDRYTASFRVVRTVETSAVRSQKGNGEVTTVSTERTVDSVIEPLGCDRRLTIGDSVLFLGMVDLEECVRRGMFLF